MVLLWMNAVSKHPRKLAVLDQNVLRIHEVDRPVFAAAFVPAGSVGWMKRQRRIVVSS